MQLKHSQPLIEHEALREVEPLLEDEPAESALRILMKDLPASAPVPRASFQQALRLRLQRQPLGTVAQRGPSSRRGWRRAWSSTSLSVALVAVALLLLVMSGSAAGRLFFERVTPFEQAVPPELPRTNEQAPPAETSAVQRPMTVVTLPQMTFDEIEQQVGFVLLLPTYLPGDCPFKQAFAFADVRDAHINYRCVGIHQQAIKKTPQPRVAQGASAEIMIGDIPATFIDGAWVRRQGESTLHWETGPKELQFVIEGVYVRVNSQTLDKQALIQVAQSLKRRGTP